MAVRVRIALIAGFVVLLGADDCDEEKPNASRPAEPTLLPAVATVEIVPAHVSATVGARFTLSAQLKDSFGTILSDPRIDSVFWKATQGPPVSPGPSNSVVINAPTTAPSIVVIVASVGGVTATDTIRVSEAPANAVPASISSAGTTSNGLVTTAPLASTDWIRAPHSTQPEVPSIALVDGHVGGAQRNDSAFAFVDSRQLDDFNCNGSMCGEITIFSPALGVRRDTASWSAGCDFVDFLGGAGGPTGCQSPAVSSPLTPLPQRVHVPVVIWQASNAPDADNRIMQDTAYALSVFTKPWLGLQLDITVYIAGAATETLKYFSSCNDPEYDITNQLIGIPVQEFLPNRITVVYVDRIVSARIPDNEISAFTCPYDPAEGPVVLISNGGAGGSTLAHELGHALGEWDTDSTVHTNPIPGFEESNLMWSDENGDTRSIRAGLTLGQLFQMSLRDQSFVKRSRNSPGSSVPCHPNPGTAVPCPRLAKDLKP